VRIGGFKSFGESTVCEHGSEILGSINLGEFLDYLSDFQFLKEFAVT
jgi:hypothetical protein